MCFIVRHALVRIAPSLLAADFTQLGEQIRAAESAGADLFHLDVMDGRFVPNITMGPFIVEAVRRVTSLMLDVHLMIVEPDHLLPAFASAGATRINVHWEACPNLQRTVQSIHELGCKAGVAINPQTPADHLTEFLHMIDAVLVMTVNPGFGGQEFMPETLPKIAQLRDMTRDYPIEIAVDGGINAETAAQVVEAGATMLVVGTGIFSKQHTIQAGIDAIRRAVEISKPR